MKTQNSQEPPPASGSWMEDALAWMELSAEVTAALAATAGNGEHSNSPEASSELFGAEAEHERAENLGKTVRWLIGQIDRIHLALCPGQNGVWQERVRQTVEAAEKAPNGELADSLRPNHDKHPNH